MKAFRQGTWNQRWLVATGYQTGNFADRTFCPRWFCQKKDFLDLKAQFKAQLTQLRYVSKMSVRRVCSHAFFLRSNNKSNSLMFVMQILNIYINIWSPTLAVGFSLKPVWLYVKEYRVQSCRLVSERRPPAFISCTPLQVHKVRVDSRVLASTTLFLFRSTP